jgi:hypothetical protein
MATRLSLEEWRAVYIAISNYRASVLQVLNIFTEDAALVRGKSLPPIGQPCSNAP